MWTKYVQQTIEGTDRLPNPSQLISSPERMALDGIPNGRTRICSWQLRGCTTINWTYKYKNISENSLGWAILVLLLVEDWKEEEQTHWKNDYYYYNNIFKTLNSHHILSWSYGNFSAIVSLVRIIHNMPSCQQSTLSMLIVALTLCTPSRIIGGVAGRGRPVEQGII